MSQRCVSQVIVSVGIESFFFTELIKEDSNLWRYVVDVRSFIRPPPREHRTGTVFPDVAVVAQVRGSPGFQNAQYACRHVLEKYGLAIIGCRGGRHRAPTVAYSIANSFSHLIHSSLSFISIQDLLMLFRHWICEYSDASIVRHISLHSVETLCVGWKCHSFLSKFGIEFCALEFGQLITYLKPEPLESTLAGTGRVKFVGSDVEHQILLNFLLPISICACHVGFVV